MLVVALTAALVVLVRWSLRAFGARSVWFAFLVVWLPMVWLGTMSRLAVPQLPERCHALRRFERDGHLYELLGVRLVKRLLRRGPFAVFNPELHLPTEKTPATRSWWSAAGWTLLFNVVVNGYPVMLQRYNRALLHKRFDTIGT